MIQEYSRRICLKVVHYLFCLTVLNAGCDFVYAQNTPNRQLKCYKITDQSLARLKNEGVIKSVLNKLKRLKDYGYESENEFIQALESKIGKSAVFLYKSRILKHTGKKGRCPNRKIGMSVKGRPVEMFQTGEGRNSTLIIASLSGNEKAGGPLLNQLKKGASRLLLV